MHVRALLLASLLGLMLTPLSAAQTAGVELLTDATGDPQLTAEGNPVGDPLTASGIDLTSLTVEETATDLVFHLGLAALPGSDEPGQSYGIQFRVQGTVYRITAYYSTFGAEGPQGGAWLARIDPATGRATSVGSLAFEATSEGLTMQAPRASLTDRDGATPFPGMTVDGFQADAQVIDMRHGQINLGPAGSVPLPSMAYSDRMPDKGNGTIPLPITIGPAQTGHARLYAETPMRASNGEATTFVYELDAHNTGSETDRFELRAIGAPSKWRVELPIPALEIPAGSNATVPVLVTTPFSHQHGSADTFLVELHSLSDAGSVGRIEVGVRYNDIPQPAGHHDTLWFHSTRDEVNQFASLIGTALGRDFSLGILMNAAEGFEAATGEPVPAEPTGGIRIEADPDEPLASAHWLIRLAPSLEMGLDFDTARTGTISLPIETTLPVPGLTIEGRIIHVTGADPRYGEYGILYGPANERTTVARIEAVGPVDLDPGAKTVLETTVTPTPESDLLPFAPDAALVLQLNVTYTRPDLPFGPWDMPKLNGGSMQLPLNEYRDPVDDLYSSLGNLAIHAESSQDRLVNPGAAAIYRFRLMDHGGAAGTYDISITGEHSHWATVVGGNGVRIEKEGTAEVFVGVEVPKDAPDGQVADFTMQITNRADPSLRSLARFAAQVDSRGDHADETDELLELQGLASKSKDSPAAPPLVLIAGLVAIGLRRRLR